MRLTIRPELINPAGLLSGPVAYAMIDYCMGSALWVHRERGERIATISISINYLRTAREGDVICESKLDRRNDRVAVLRSEVSDDSGPPARDRDRQLLDLPEGAARRHDRGAGRAGGDRRGLVAMWLQREITLRAGRAASTSSPTRSRASFPSSPRSRRASSISTCCTPPPG